MDSHERALGGAAKVLKVFFILFFIFIFVVFAQKILDHTDGQVITQPEDSTACQNAQAQEIMEDVGVGNALKCKK